MQNFTLSIVSHGHKAHIEYLLGDLAQLARNDINIVLTINLHENLPHNIESLPYAVKVIHNQAPKGFGANHNAAFVECDAQYFVVLNPDVRLIGDPFTALLTYMTHHPKSICAPVVVNQKGVLEDSARLLPTPFFLFKKLIAKVCGFKLKLDKLKENQTAFLPDWIAGMFVVVPHEVYQAIGGFDERYHMYYEDVDLSVRARLAGCEVAVVKDAKVIHEAQRDSHKKFKYFMWHAVNVFKFFTSRAYWDLHLKHK